MNETIISKVRKSNSNSKTVEITIPKEIIDYNSIKIGNKLILKIIKVIK